jgi:hypothetical protein
LHISNCTIKKSPDYKKLKKICHLDKNKDYFKRKNFMKKRSLILPILMLSSSQIFGAGVTVKNESGTITDNKGKTATTETGITIKAKIKYEASDKKDTNYVTIKPGKKEYIESEKGKRIICWEVDSNNSYETKAYNTPHEITITDNGKKPNSNQFLSKNKWKNITTVVYRRIKKRN